MKKSYILMGMAMAFAPANLLAQSVLSPRTAIAVNEKMSSGVATQSANVVKVSAYVTIDPAQTSWEALGITPLAQFGNTATTRLSIDDIKALSGKKGVKYVQVTSNATQTLDLARKETGVDDVHNGVSLKQGYTGKGVVVGIVDGGFDYTHQAFYDPNTGKCRIKRVWEQCTESMEGAKAPEKFGYGVELNTPKLIGLSSGDVTNNSHGTHVAGIAAGSDYTYNNGAYVGVAPDAEIVLVSIPLATGVGTSADIANAVKYIFDYADEVGKPCVVNLSLGNQDGPHDGTSTFDTMTDAMQGPGRLIVGAAGNHRTDAFHIDHTFATPDAAPLRTFVKYKVAPSNSVSGGTIEIWGEKGVNFTVDIAAYSTFNKKDARSTTVYPAEGVTNVDFGKYATGTWKVASEVSPLNGKPHVVLTSALTSIRNNYAIALTVTPKTAGRVNIWSDNTYLALESRDIEGFSAPDAASSTLCEIGGTGKRILTVGSYTTRNEYTTNGGQQATLQETVGDLSSFSSYGPTVDGRMKPNITAPGCFIISAVSNNDASGNLMYAEYNENFGRYNQYGYMQGTSMASPFVAGIVATWLQAYPQLTPEQLHEIVQNTARKDSFTATAPDSNWGYGKINALDGLRQCIEKQETGCVSVAMPFDGTVRIADGNILLGFARDTQATLCITSMTGSTLFSKQLGKRSAGETLSVAVPQLPKGVYLLSVKTPTATKTFKFVWQ